MPDPILVSYIQNCLKENYTINQIYSELIDNGYIDQEVADTLKYLNIKDPNAGKSTISKDDSARLKYEEETRNRNLVNLIHTGYSPHQIELDLISSGMDKEKALKTVTTLIPPYKDKIDFIGYFIQSLLNSGYTHEQIRLALKKQQIPEPIIRNINNIDNIKEILTNIEKERTMVNYKLGIVQRIYVVLFDPTLTYVISKGEHKFFHPLFEIMRIQLSLLTGLTIVWLALVYKSVNLDLNRIDWPFIIGDYLYGLIDYFNIYGFQILIILSCTLVLKIITVLLRERLRLDEALRIIAYAHISSFLFFLGCLTINWVPADKIVIYIFFYLIFSIWRMIIMFVGIRYYLYSSNFKTAVMVIIITVLTVLAELYLGYWSSVTNMVFL
jgi:hypothetical protein